MPRGSRFTLMDETLADFLHRFGWVTFRRTIRPQGHPPPMAGAMPRRDALLIVPVLLLGLVSAYLLLAALVG